LPYKDIIYTKDAGVAWITINRPEKMNAMCMQTLDELLDAFEDATDDLSVGVVVLTGAGNKAFCTGGDLGEMNEGNAQEWVQKTNRLLLRLTVLIRNMPKPVIAAVNGACVGGGNELNILCDMSICVEHARFSQGEVKIGAVPLWAASQLLPRIVGEKKAREIVFLGRMLTAQDAEKLGLVNKVVAADQLDEEVQKWCVEILSMSPQALKLSKTALNFESDNLWPAFNWGMTAIGLQWGSDELMEGINSFKQKRRPDFNKFRSKP